MKQIDEREIIGRILAGDREAFAELVDAYQGPVFSLALRMTGNARDADDLTQESFLRAYLSLGRFREGERFFPWMYTVSLNVIRNHLRSQKALPEKTAGEGMPETADPRGGPDDEMFRRERSRRLQGCLLKLPVAVREAVVLRFYEGLSFEDISLVTGDSLSGAKMKVYRGLEKIRVVMKEQGFHGGESET